MSNRRRSSQYTLFPNCSTLPSSENSDISSSRKTPSRHSSNSSRSSSRNSRKSADLPLRDRSSTTTNNESSHPVDKRRSGQSEEMGRLIPLKLDGSCVIKSSPNLPSPVFSTKSSSITPSMPPREQASPKAAKKARPGLVTDLTILPYTQEDWKKVMGEVRTLYAKGQYKYCAARCKQILDNIKDPHQVHPLYSIYLSFFAASSLEMTASTLHDHSSTKLPIYQESLSFYKKAQSSIEDISWHSPTKSAIYHSASASITSSLHSSSSLDSIFSSPANSARSSIVNSPFDEVPPSIHKRTISASSSFSSLSSATGSSSSSRGRKKKVSFSMDLDFFLEQEKKDSSSSAAVSLLDSFPAPPTLPDPRITSSKDLVPSSQALISPRKQPQPELQIQTQTQTYPNQSISSYLLSQSLSRYTTHLHSLSTQLTYHITSVHTQISTLSLARKARRGNTATQFCRDLFPEEEEEWDDLGREARATQRGEEMSTEENKKRELRERIERLREVGWRRARFDGERYRLLCERALVEVCGR